jgi:sigma-B regulation protein RsbU (phosphoserine phosphatase)
LEQNLKAAAEIQMALLPQTFPDIDEARFSFAFHPCDRIGGNLFNVERLDEEHIGVYMLDVGDHGVTAAMIAALVHQAMPSSLSAGEGRQSLPAGSSGTLLTPVQTFELIENEFPVSRFGRLFSMAYLILHLKSGTFRYSCAGHPPVIQQQKDGAVLRHHKGGGAIGSGESRDEGKGRLQKGDRLFMYTDGIVKNEDGGGDTYGLERLERLLTETIRTELDTVPALLIQDLHTFSSYLPFQDDIAFLALEYTGAAR